MILVELLAAVVVDVLDNSCALVLSTELNISSKA